MGGERLCVLVGQIRRCVPAQFPGMSPIPGSAIFTDFSANLPHRTLQNNPAVILVKRLASRKKFLINSAFTRDLLLFHVTVSVSPDLLLFHMTDFCFT